MTDHYARLPSPIGVLHATANDSHLTGLYVSNHRLVETLANQKESGSPILDLVREQLDSYWRGTLTTFTVPIAPGGTEWQRCVWNELMTVPFGETVTYLELARRMDHPNSARAVGSANARNPISVIIPCHRVMSTSGALTGYAGGLNRKV